MADDSCATWLTLVAYGFAGFQILVCIYSFLANTTLIYKQRKILLWYSERPLYLGILFANSVASLVHAIKALLEIFEHADPESSNFLILYQQYMSFVGDAAVVSSIYSIAALTIANFRHIQLLHRGSSIDQSSNGRVSKSIALLIFIWALACSCAAFGLGIHEEYGLVDVPDWFHQFGHIFLTLTLQFLMAIILFKTHKRSKRVQTDFAVSRAQQDLKFRIFLSRVTKRTKIMIPILATNVALWIILLITDAVLDRIMSLCNNALWEIFVDVTTITFCAVYPFLIVRNSLRMGQRIKSIFCCGYKVENDVIIHKIFTVDTPAIEVTPVFEASESRQRSNHSYWKILESQWELVEREKTTKL